MRECACSSEYLTATQHHLKHCKTCRKDWTVTASHLVSMLVIRISYAFPLRRNVTRDSIWINVLPTKRIGNVRLECLLNLTPVSRNPATKTIMNMTCPTIIDACCKGDLQPYFGIGYLFLGVQSESYFFTNHDSLNNNWRRYFESRSAKMLWRESL